MFKIIKFCPGEKMDKQNLSDTTKGGCENGTIVLANSFMVSYVDKDMLAT